MSAESQESSYAFVYRSVVIRADTPKGAIDMLSFRLEVDGARIGNNEALKVGQSHYTDVRLGEEIAYRGVVAFESGVWAVPRGILEHHPAIAEQVIRKLESEVTELMWSIDRENPNRRDFDFNELRLEVSGPALPAE